MSDKLIQRQVIVTWIKPEEKLPPNDVTVIATISGRAGNNHFERVLLPMEHDDDGSGWWSMSYDFDELTVHAWCDIEPYEG